MSLDKKLQVLTQQEGAEAYMWRKVYYFPNYYHSQNYYYDTEYLVEVRRTEFLAGPFSLYCKEVYQNRQNTFANIKKTSCLLFVDESRRLLIE